jgi:signal transduction histidine kinase
LKLFTILSGKSSIILLSIILLSAFSLSLLSYQFSNTVLQEILDIARQDTASNAKVQARSISLLLEDELEAVNSNLISVSHSNITSDPHTLNLLLDSLQHTTQDITDFYIYVDATGNLVSSSNVSNQLQLGKTNLSQARFFSESRTMKTTSFVGVDDIFDKKLRFYISYPIFTESTRSMKFNGIVAAAISPDIAKSFFQTKFPPEFERNDILVVSELGNIFYSTYPLMTGKNTRDPDLQDIKIVQFVNKFLNTDRPNGTSTVGFISTDNEETIVGEPVILANNTFLTSFVRAQNYLTSNMNHMYDTQNMFSTITGIVMGIIALICTIVLLSWNKRLSVAVNSKTQELEMANMSLKKSNQSLEDANRKLSVANQQLSSHDKMQNEFINIASHEIKTPAQAILFYSDLLQGMPESNPTAVQAIVKNAYRLQRLTSDILDVTRIESKTLRLNKVKFNLSDIIAQLLEEFQARVDIGKLRFHFEPNDIEVNADKQRVIQVICNLLDNAIKFTERGAISVIVQQLDSQVHISVRDTGSGVDPEVRARLFTKFASRSHTGTGLGLYISKNIVEAHGGKMWMKDAVNPRGSIFTFSLPLPKTDSQDLR